VKSISHYIEIFLESPGWKTFFSVIIPIFTGILSGIFVAEISSPSGLNWAKFYHAKSFYGLLLIVVIIYFYNRALFNHETSITRFSDSDYCLAYIRSKCLPEAAEKYKEKIRKGEGGELLQIMAELKKSLR
jgi:uncharacterized membrane protein YfcA